MGLVLDTHCVLTFQNSLTKPMLLNTGNQQSKDLKLQITVGNKMNFGNQKQKIKSKELILLQHVIYLFIFSQLYGYVEANLIYFYDIDVFLCATMKQH